MRLLVVHQNFPGQFAHLVSEWAARPGWEVRGLGRHTAPGLPGFDALLRHTPTRSVRSDQHPYLRQMEAATLNGQSALRAMLALRRSGYTPDVIVAHPGWGDTLYAKDAFPDARLVHLCEWYYSADGADMGFDPEFPIRLDARARIRNWNALHTLNLTQCDAAITPTRWQKSRHPALFQPRLQVQHEGIATHNLAPDPQATVTTPSGVLLRAGDPDRPVITYVARHLEPYRGFHIFMRALEHIQRLDARCHAVIVGADGVGYGSAPPRIGNRPAAPHWRALLLDQVRLDATRTHFMGTLPRDRYLRVLQVSSAHVYLTYPFVLSWSMLEAMACGAPLVASDTAPVREVLQDGANARLVDFFDAQALAEATLAVMRGDTSTARRRRQAMADVQRYSIEAGVRGYDRVLGVGGEAEPVGVGAREGLMKEALW